MEIGNRIRAARKAAGLTQKALAEKARISLNAVHQYESGLRYPKAEFLVKIAAGLGVSVESLLFPSGEDPNLANEAKIPEPESDNPYLASIAESLKLLNVRGQRIAVERIKELTEIPKYQAPE